jgi:CRISPR/Cas system CSM-associated protein Csm3 (group 7 of RAMP superfamily)
MARLNNGRFILSGTLRFDEPFLIGGVDVEAGLDTSPMFDGNGCALVPGTSLAGVLRSWISTQVVGVSADDIEQVFGGNDSTSGASRIHIDDVALRDVENSGLVLSTVDGVGIDRYTGAAAHGVKYDQTVVAGSPIGDLRIVCEIAEGDNPLFSSEHSVMQALSIALREPRLRLGRGTTKGFGLFVVDNLKLILQRANAEGVQHRLAGTGEEVVLEEKTSDLLRGRTTIHLEFESIGAVFTKASIAGTTVDVIPRVEPRNGEASLVLPATSIRGVLRSEGERIMRTLLDTSVKPDTPHYEQTQVPLVSEMYGASPQMDTETSVSVIESESLGKACFSLTSAFAPLGSVDDWNAVLKAATKKKTSSEDDRLKAERSLVDACNKMPLLFTHHVALDRWTGAAADKMLYTVLEPTIGSWRELTIELDDNRLGEMREPALVLLLHSLQSLHAGDIGLGWGTTRGHGTVKITRIRINGLGVDVDLPELGAWIWNDIEAAEPEFIREIRQSWTNWLSVKQGGEK